MEILLEQPSAALESTKTAARKHHRLDSIQALRGIAASLVVLHHYGWAISTYTKQTPWIQTSGIGSLGAAGVDIFFVISGFIMVYTTQGKCGASQSAKFLKKRALRIYPLYWFWTTVLLLLCAGGLALKSHTLSAAYVLSSYALLPAFNGSSFHPLLDQGWTLTFELFFYLVFAASMFIPQQLGRLLFLIGSILTVFLVAHAFLHETNGATYLLTNPIMFEFLYGACIAECLLHLPGDMTSTRSQVIAFACVAAGFVLLLAKAGGPMPREMRFLEWGIPGLFIVLGAALWRQPVLPVLVFLGNASYSIYLTHSFFTLAYSALIKRMNPLAAIPPDVTIIVASLLTIAITSQGFPLIEKRLQRFG